MKQNHLHLTLNKKLKSFLSLDELASNLSDEDLPRNGSMKFDMAMAAFKESLDKYFNSISAYGYCPFERVWYAKVEVSDIIDARECTPDRTFVKMWAAAQGATPQDCIENLISRYNDAISWQLSVSSK
jgi:hypothetical protein